MKYYGAITDDYDIVNKKYVDAHSGGGAKNVWYGTCSTSPATAAKVVTTTSGDFTLEDGNAVIVYFESGNLATSQMTLDIDSIGAVDVVTGSELCGVQYGTPVMFVYDEDVLAFIAVNRNKATATYYGFSKLPKVTQVSITVANWNATTTCTKTVTGVTTSNSVIVSPAPASISDYVSAGVYCSAQGSGTLTFTCSTTPSADITVNIMIVG